MEKLILAIDDEVNVQEVIRRALGKNQYRCSTAFDGLEGLEKARWLRPDLILLDLMIPKMSGLGLLRELKNDPELADIPVIILTALSDEEIKREGLQLGATEFLCKTCGLKKIISVVEEHVNGVVH